MSATVHTPRPLASGAEERGATGLSAAGFRRIAEIALEEAGLSIPDGKIALVQSRLSRRMRAIGIAAFDQYVALVSRPENREERRELVSVLTTNVSSFFRERHHFDVFAASVLPPLADRLTRRGGPVRIWSAGCSSGQEPYSIAMECLRAIPDAAERDLLILATDIDPAILKRAAAGRYSETEMAGVPQADRDRFFLRDRDDAQFTVSDALRRLIRFRELNLHGAWPMRGRFDAIFCRNVVIYFDEAHQARLWPRFHASLMPGGLLFLGHSERIHPLEGSGFSGVGVTAYRKI